MAKVGTDQKKRDSELLAKRATQVQRGAARASVLGVNDGLVSTLCIVLAVAGAGADQNAVLLAGTAGLIAGAISMAAGEWISVQSQVELFQGILRDLKSMVKGDRELLKEQLEDNFTASGMATANAAAAAADIAKHDDQLFDLYATRVMGINPDELGSPWVAAFSSFLLFSAGAIAPLAPWLFTDGMTGVILSTGFTAVASLIVGGYVGKTSGSGTVFGAIRQLLIVIFAAAVTYGIGNIFGNNFLV